MWFGKGIPESSQAVKTGLSELGVKGLVDMKQPLSSGIIRASCCVGHSVHVPYWDLHVSYPFFLLRTYAHNIITTNIASTILAFIRVVYVQPQCAKYLPFSSAPVCFRLFQPSPARD